VVHVTLGAGEHGIVVGNHHAARVLGAEFVGVDGGDARDQAVGRRVHDEIVDLAAATLRGDRQRAVFDERAVVDQLGDVLPRGALVGLAAALDRGRAVLIEGDGVAGDQFGEIRADVIEIDGLFLDHVMGIDLCRFEIQDGLVLHQGDANTGDHLRHLAAVRRRHQVLHLHGFEHGDLLAGAHEVAFPHLDRNDRALQRRGDGNRTCRSRRRYLGLGRAVLRSTAGIGKQRLRRGFLCCSNQLSGMRIDETGADTVGGKIRMREDRSQERNVGGDAADPELAQRTLRLLHHVGPLSARGMHDHLGQQRVEGSAGLVAGVAKGIDADAGTGRQIEHRQRSAGRLGGAGLVHHFHIDAKLHGVAARFWDVGLRQAERAKRGAGRDRKLRLHQIDAQHCLGYGMLDLKPRVGPR